MTVLDLSISQPHSVAWRDADWAMYERALEWLNGNRAFVTFYHGRLEVVSRSFRHDRLSNTVLMMITVLAEETDTPFMLAGSTTWRRRDLQAAVEADCAFYIANAERMSDNRPDVDLQVDPPPDLVVEVEITHRLQERLDIYREMGVPELWRCDDENLRMFVNRGERWEEVDRSPTFPQLSRGELTEFARSGLDRDTGTWLREFRTRVCESVKRQQS